MHRAEKEHATGGHFVVQLDQEYAAIIWWFISWKMEQYTFEIVMDDSLNWEYWSDTSGE